MSNNLAPASATNAAAAPDTGITPPVGDTPDPLAPAPGADDAPAVDPPAADPAAARPPLTPSAERIAELVAERNATRDYAEYWRQQALAGIRPPAAPGSAPAAQAAPKPAPTLQQFQNADGTYDAVKWSAANATWLEEQVEIRSAAIVEQRLSVRDQQQQQDQQTTSWQQRCNEFRAKQPDFDAVTSNPTLPIPKSVADVIVTLEKGPAVFHHLAMNPAVAARIARLAPLQQAAALGAIEAKVGDAPPAPPPARRNVTNAPPPPSAVRTGGGSEVNMATLPLDDYLELRLKQMRGK